MQRLTYVVWVASLLFIELITSCKAGILPLNRDCTWVHQSLPSEQQSCIDNEFDTNEATSWVSASNNEIHTALEILKFNPIGSATGAYFKTDILTWVRLLMITLCGADKKEIAQDFLGVKFYVLSLGKVFNPVYWVLKALSYIPKVGKVFKPVVKIVDVPYKQMQKLEKNVYDKCDKANAIVQNIFRIVDFLWYVQMSAYILDDLVIPASNMGICHNVNSKVNELISEEGKCNINKVRRRLEHDDTLSIPQTMDRNLSSSTGKDDFKKAFDDRRAAFNSIKTAAEGIQAALQTMEDILSPIQNPINTVKNAMVDMTQDIQPILDELEFAKPVLDDLNKATKYISCDYLGVLCALDDLIDKAVNGVMKAAGLESLDHYVGQLFDGLDFFPELDFDFDVLDFDAIESALVDAVDDITTIFDNAKELSELARSVLDPSVDAASALDKIDSGADQHRLAYSENGESVSFTCPTGFYPVVYDAFHARFDCGEDISSYMRFPCDKSSSCVNVPYGDLLECRDLTITDFDQLNFSPDVFYASYRCFDETKDIKDLGLLNDLQQYNMQIDTYEREERFPVAESRNLINTQYGVTLSLIRNAECNLDRVILFDHYDSGDVPEVFFNSRSTDDIPNLYFDNFSLWMVNRRGNTYAPHGWPWNEDMTERWLWEDTGYFFAITCSTDGVFYQGCTRSDANSKCPSEPVYGGGYDEYHALYANCADAALRKSEYDKRKVVQEMYLAEYYAQVNFCESHIPSCEGKDFCDLSKCPRRMMDYACVWKPENGRQTLTFAFTQSRSRNPIKQITCAAGTSPKLVKAEIGRFDDVQDVTTIQAQNCDDQKCTVDPEFLATQTSLDSASEPQTVRVDTYCECGEGYQPEPLLDGSCVPCAFGEYRVPGMSQCTNCPSGTRSVLKGEINTCVECSSGTYSRETGSFNCIDCPAGTYNPSAGGTSVESCLQVPLDHFSTGDRTGYQECPEGTTNYDEDRSGCFPCGFGFVRRSGDQGCTACPPGTYSPTETGPQCLDVPPGGYQPQQAQSTFILAPQNFYVEDSRATEPKPCVEGKITAFQGADSAGSCEDPVPIPDCSIFDTCEDLLLFLGVNSSVVGDGYCWGDPRYCVNTELCDFDGGDCCPETCQKAEVAPESDEDENVIEILNDYYEYSCHESSFRCLAPRDLSDIECSDDILLEPLPDSYSSDTCIQRPSSWGNGICDPDQNFASCTYDGGDCCKNTCQKSYLQGSCADNTLTDCRDPKASVDIISPEFYNLPEREIDVVCEDIPSWAQVSASDNDPCFDSLIQKSETGQRSCQAWTYERKWTATDPSGNDSFFVQTMNVASDLAPPVWHEFPSDQTINMFQQKSLHPDVTGWPQITRECSLPVQMSWTDKAVTDTSCGEGYRIERTWSAIDACGNEALKVQSIYITVEDSTSTFGAAWNLHFTSVGGDLDINVEKGQFQGSVGASDDVKLKAESVQCIGCEQGLTPYAVIAGQDASLSGSVFDFQQKIAYGSKVNVKKEYEDQTYQENAIDWTNTAQMVTSNSQTLASATWLRSIFDGQTIQICNAIESPCANTGVASMGTTAGTATRNDLDDGTIDVVLSGSSEYINIFEIELDLFLFNPEEGSSKSSSESGPCMLRRRALKPALKSSSSCSVERIQWTIDVPEDSIVIINVRGDFDLISSKKTSSSMNSSKGSKKRKTIKMNPAVVKSMGTVAPRQVMVNLPDISDRYKLKLEGSTSYSDSSDDAIIDVMPYSLLAPHLHLEIESLDLRGQILVQDLKAKKIVNTCDGMWIGNKIIGN